MLLVHSAVARASTIEWTLDSHLSSTSHGSCACLLLEENSQLTRPKPDQHRRPMMAPSPAGQPADRSIGPYPYSSIAGVVGTRAARQKHSVRPRPRSGGTGAWWLVQRRRARPGPAPPARCHVPGPRCSARRDDRSHATTGGRRRAQRACMCPAPTAYGTPQTHTTPTRPRRHLPRPAARRPGRLSVLDGWLAGRQPARWHDG